MSAGTPGEVPPHVVHELRNHLAVIKGFCELLLEEASEAESTRADLLEIERAAVAALRLLDAIPDLPP